MTLAALIPGGVNKSVSELQSILQALGVPANVVAVDNRFGPATSGAWRIVAIDLGLDPRFDRVDPSTARVADPTYRALSREAVIRQAPRPRGKDDFERLNNAIVAASLVGPAWSKLADDWANDTTPTKRSIQMALPFVWARTLKSYWTRYAAIWEREPPTVQVRVVAPVLLEPGGTVQAFRDLWAPALDSAKGAADAATRALAERFRGAARAAGEEFAKGGQTQTTNWLWGLSGVGLAVGLLWLLGRRRGTAGLGQWLHVDGSCTVKGAGTEGEYPCDDTYENIPRNAEVTFHTTPERHFEMPRRVLSWHEIEAMPGVAPKPKFRRAVR